MNIVLQIFTLIGALGMFLYGMTLMSEGLQKFAGDKLRSFLASMTSNPLKRVLTGVGVTFGSVFFRYNHHGGQLC